MGFKHTGLFPEQAVNWDWMMDKIKNAKREIKVLNLFAYTGGATVACASAGASVCHVDSSKGMVTWAKENITSSGLAERPVRYIIDDVVKFVNREIRRGNKYDAIIMDYLIIHLYIILLNHKYYFQIAKLLHLPLFHMMVDPLLLHHIYCLYVFHD